jgi:pimeloyl-ACP methyl ester carboxylesterase
MAQDILGLMDYLEIKEAHLLGTSMGGMIAQHVALMAPARLNSLILAGTTSWGEA